MRRGEFRLVYTVSEAAELLGLGRSTAYDLAARGELPTVRLGRRVAVTRPALAALLGFDPPLPHELDEAHRAVPAPTPVQRSERTSTGQPPLPFTG
jgi:excisionase family DNA binding protein